MITKWQNAPITRQGSPIAGSPYLVKLRYRRLHVEPIVAPIAAKRPIQEFLIFAKIDAPVCVGDTALLSPENCVKIIDVRSYPSSLQCIVLRNTYQSLLSWRPLVPALSRVNADKSLPDMIYQSSGSTFALIEPRNDDLGGALPAGQLDRRRGYAYSPQPIKQLTVLYFDSDYWLATEHSSVWPISNDYRAPVRRLLVPPVGV